MKRRGRIVVVACGLGLALLCLGIGFSLPGLDLEHEVEAKPASSLESVVTSAPMSDDEARPERSNIEPDDLLASILAASEEEKDPERGSERLVDAFMDDGKRARMLFISARLRELTEEPYAELWKSGEFRVVDSVDCSVLEDKQGRPRPCQIWSSGDETRIVVLSEEEHPEAWALLAEKRQIMDDSQALKQLGNQRLRVRGGLKPSTPFGR